MFAIPSTISPRSGTDRYQSTCPLRGVSDPPASATRRVYVSASPPKDMSYSPWMACSQRWGMKSYGSCVIVSQERFCWLGASGVVSEADLACCTSRARYSKHFPYRFMASSRMGNILSEMLSTLFCRKCHTNYATFIICVKRLSRSTKRIVTKSAELKKHIREVRPIERTLEHRQDTEAEGIRGYCLAVRSALPRRWATTTLCFWAETPRAHCSDCCISRMAC